jgi:hypothetical protein
MLASGQIYKEINYQLPTLSELLLLRLTGIEFLNLSGISVILRNYQSRPLTSRNPPLKSLRLDGF